MGRKSDEFRAQARRLEERAETVVEETIRLALIGVARRWRGLAQDAERYEMEATRPASALERQNRKAAIAALGRAVRVYWDHEKARPLPDFLAKLAVAADEACSTKPTTPEPNADPEPSSPSCPQTPWKQTT